MSHDIENAKDKMLGAAPNLKRSMTICQGIEKIFTVYCKLYEEMKRQALFKKKFNFFQRNKALKFLKFQL